MKHHLLSFLKFKQHDINYYQTFNFISNLSNYTFEGTGPVLWASKERSIIDDNLQSGNEVKLNNKPTNKFIQFELKQIKRYELSQNNDYVFSLLNANNEPEHYQIINYVINDKLTLRSSSKESYPQNESNDNINKQSVELSIINKKRKQNEVLSSNKKNKIIKHIDFNHQHIIDFNKMISASSVVNYFLNDPLIDFLKYYKVNEDTMYNINKKQFFNKTNFNKNNFEDILLKKGNEFETYILNHIKNKYEYIIIGESYEAKSIPLFEKTVKAINDKIPVIIQGVLHFYEKNIYGCPDLIVRGDILNKMYKNTLSEHEIDCYYIVDIKWSCLKMSCKGDYILNSGFQSYYKGQILIYTMALENILKKKINKGFILAKKYQWKTFDSWQDKIGVIDYNSKDFIYYNKIDKAIEWNLKLREEGKEWKLLPPTIPELYPNMKNNKDGKYRKIKNIQANKINEITLVWNVQVNHRNNAFKNGVYSTLDKKCTSKILGLNGINANKIDAILDINRGDKIVSPKKIKNNYFGWRKVDNKYLEVYLDYETINDLEGENFIFMIGIGYVKNNEWKYKCFLLENKKKQIEFYSSFWLYVDELIKEFNKQDVLFVHWYSAEPIMYNKAVKLFNLKEKTFLDLYKIFVEEPVVIKGAKSFKLKEIAKAMYNNNLIKTSWDESNKCDNGLNAMILANEIYEKNDNVQLTDMLDIVNYNEVDCKVLYEIITYLRSNH